MLKPSRGLFSGRSRVGVLLLWIFCFTFVFIILYLTVSCSVVITCWERTDLLALLCVMFLCVFITFSCCVSDKVWYLIVSTPYLCLLLYCFSILMKFVVYYKDPRCIFSLLEMYIGKWWGINLWRLIGA